MFFNKNCTMVHGWMKDAAYVYNSRIPQGVQIYPGSWLILYNDFIREFTHQLVIHFTGIQFCLYSAEFAGETPVFTICWYWEENHQNEWLLFYPCKYVAIHKYQIDLSIFRYSFPEFEGYMFVPTLPRLSMPSISKMSLGCIICQSEPVEPTCRCFVCSIMHPLASSPGLQNQLAQQSA